jgi:multicomponent Na+:H+ antiporter subunit E
MRIARRALVIARFIAFLPFFLRELVLANVQVALEVITPTNRMRPGIIRVPLRVRSDLQIMLFANLISLTPGTLTLEVTEDRSSLYVHGLHVKDPEDFRSKMGALEDRLLRVFR